MGPKSGRHCRERPLFIGVRKLRYWAELPGEAVEFVARQVQVPASEMGFYDWTGRTVEYHRAQIREHLGFRECSVADAEKLTVFVARYLRLRDLQREIEEGLNVMESSNGANSVIAYGKGGEIASNRRDEQEMFVLCLRILQSALVYVNTLMLQDVLGEPEWAEWLYSRVVPSEVHGFGRHPDPRSGDVHEF
ncbi:Tn3 family transposase [Streptomyces sp. NPDC001832]|uniref:Tn3 family transposase n=1 Tax=Streptomyces sp. NPDC001832 TaxID=3154527 RepID=UPI00331984AE